MTTEPARLCSTEWANTIVQEDNTIRFLDSSRRDWCIFKKYADFKAGDEVWYAPCDVAASNLNKAGKYTWIYNQETKQIQSKGALELKNKRLCWRIPQTSKLGKQRIRIQACDDDDINQKWNIIAGRLHPVGGERLCVGIKVLVSTNTKDTKHKSVNSCVCAKHKHGFVFCGFCDKTE